MALTFFGAYALQPGTTSVTMVPPGSTLAGDLDIIWSASKLSGVEPTVPSNSGFNMLGSAVVGTGADGEDSGPIRLTAWARVLTAASTNTTITLTGGSVINGGGAVFRKTGSDPTWYPVFTTGTDTSSGTSFAATADAQLNLGIGDWLYTVGASTVNTTISSGRGVTTTGWTATNTGIDSGGTTNGNNVFVWSDRTGTGTAGASTTAPVVTGTMAAATTGGAIFIRVAAVDRTQVNKVFAPQNHPGLRRFTRPPSGIAAPTLDQALAAAGIDDADVVGQSTLSPGVATLSPIGIDGGAVGQTSLTQTLAPAGFDSSAVGQSTLVLSLAPAGIASTEASGTSVLTPGAVTVSPASIGDGSAVGQTSLAQALAPRGIDGGAVGQTTLTQTLAPAGIAGGNVGQSSLVLTLAPFGIDASSPPGQTSLTVTVAVNPVSIPRTDAVGYTILTPGAVTISPTGIADSSQVGQSSVAALGVPLNPASIPSGDRVGNTTLTPGTVTISPAGIVSGQAVGTSVLGRFLVPLGVPSLAAVGQTTLEQFAPSTVFHLSARVVGPRYGGTPAAQHGATTGQPNLSGRPKPKLSAEPADNRYEVE